MTAINRSLDSGVATAITAQHTQPFHLVRIVFPTETVYLSEGPGLTAGDTPLGQAFIEGRVKVSNLSWTGDGQQTCTLDILNVDNYAANLFIANRIADARVTIWLIMRKPDGSYEAPTLYADGSCDASEFDTDLHITLVTSSLKTKFFPNTYAGSAGLNHLCAEGTVVFWNSTSYVLERDYTE